jgi:thymidylate synthase
MTHADYTFKENLVNILNIGYMDENPRPRYASDGYPAHSIFITGVFEKYNLSVGEFPLTTLRPIPVFNGVKEIRWIYQDKTSNLSVLEEKYGITWWRDWDIGDGTIGQRYGDTVRKHALMGTLLYGLKSDPFGRRHILSLWQEDDFISTEGLRPCAFQTIFSVRRNLKGELCLDMTLIQRSSDYLVAGHINKMQYVAFQMMVAKHCGYQVGEFNHFVQNLHIYDRHVEQAVELLNREPSTKQPKLVLNVEDGTNFYDITEKDFELIDYEPVRPQLKFDLGV